MLYEYTVHLSLSCEQVIRKKVTKSNSQKTKHEDYMLDLTGEISEWAYFRYAREMAEP